MPFACVDNGAPFYFIRDNKKGPIKFKLSKPRNYPGGSLKYDYVPCIQFVQFRVVANLYKDGWEQG